MGNNIEQKKTSSWRYNLKKNLFAFVAIFPAVTYIGIFFFIIIYNVIKMSLTTYSYNQPVNTMTFENYAQVFSNPEVWESTYRTFIFVLITTPLQLIVGLMMAMLINKAFKGRGFVRSLFLLPLAIPAMVTSSTILILFSNGGHMTSLLSGDYISWLNILPSDFSFIGSEFWSTALVVFGKVWRDAPISMLILLAGLQSIGQDQYEAANTMGSSNFKNFFLITIPLLMPAISSVLVLRSIEAWKEFVFALNLSPKYPLLGVLIDKYYIQQMNPGTSAVVGILLVACILVSALVIKFILNTIQKYLVRV